eukprot:503775-Rhodomonas_salina.1
MLRICRASLSASRPSRLPSSTRAFPILARSDARCLLHISSGSSRSGPSPSCLRATSSSLTSSSSPPFLRRRTTSCSGPGPTPTARQGCTARVRRASATRTRTWSSRPPKPTGGPWSPSAAR